MPLFHQPTLLTTDTYARDIVKKITRAHDRIVLITTTFRDDDPRSHAIVEALCLAADRGVEISICVDTLTYLEPKEFFLHSPKRQPARVVQAMKLERRLKHHGIAFHWLGRKASSLAAGRTHSKWLVVDDIVYAFGGVNLDNDSFENTDYMFRFYDKALASEITKEQTRIRKIDHGGGAARSRTYQLSETSTVLIDGGLIGDSIIYRRACKLAREANQIIVVSQYCPTGKLARILKQRDTLLYFNHWRTASAVNRFLISLGMFTAKHETSYTRDTYLHAKFMIFTMSNGTKTALTGSHNFMFGSGAMGTREIALETTDPRLIHQLERFYTTYVL